jgi:hypothetical protein
MSSGVSEVLFVFSCHDMRKQAKKASELVVSKSVFAQVFCTWKLCCTSSNWEIENTQRDEKNGFVACQSINQSIIYLFIYLLNMSIKHLKLYGLNTFLKVYNVFGRTTQKSKT